MIRLRNLAPLVLVGTVSFCGSALAVCGIHPLAVSSLSVQSYAALSQPGAERGGREYKILLNEFDRENYPSSGQDGAIALVWATNGDIDVVPAAAFIMTRDPYNTRVRFAKNSSDLLVSRRSGVKCRVPTSITASGGLAIAGRIVGRVR